MFVWILNFEFWILNADRPLKNFQNKSGAKYYVFIKKMGANLPRLLYKRGKGYGIRGKRRGSNRT